MLYRSLALLLVACLAGCAGRIAGAGENEPTEEAQLAARAASTPYPTNLRASNNWRAAALVDRRTNSIRVINFENRPLRDADVWVNHSFVHHVGTIPPNGYVVLSRNGFYDASGNSLANVNTSVVQAQVQTEGNLYDLQGPIAVD